MHRHIWNITVYIFIIALIALTGVAVLAIWDVLPKEFIWKAFASAGALALFILSIASALRGLKHEHTAHDTIPH